METSDVSAVTESPAQLRQQLCWRRPEGIERCAVRRHSRVPHARCQRLGE